VLGTGMPFLIEGGAETYLTTIERFANALDVETIVPGHGPIVPGGILDAYRSYLTGLVELVSRRTEPESSLEAALAAFPLPDGYVPADVDQETRAFIEGIHVFNLWRTLAETGSGQTIGAGSS
jgi:glyoxylase-like metal-dependent hydrolase (beta-lactamase superfamily II)